MTKPRIFLVNKGEGIYHYYACYADGVWGYGATMRAAYRAFKGGGL